MNKIRFFPIFLILIGLIILAENLGFTNSWETFWPLILILIGGISIFNSIEFS